MYHLKSTFNDLLAYLILVLALLLTACGGSSSGGGGNNNSSDFTIGGNVTGLGAGKSVVLQNNGDNDLTVTTDGAFNFSTSVADDGSYNVAVLTQPAGQTCTASINTGTVSGADVTNVVVTCAVNTYTIGGTATGVGGGISVVLQNNGGDDLTVSTDGAFNFSTSVADGGGYNVTIMTPPAGRTCTASSNTGTVSGANVTSAVVHCAINPVLDAEARPASANLSWFDFGATSYNLYYSTTPNCDIANYASCPGGTMLENVTSPHTVSTLSNGQNYWFKLESVESGGNGISNEAGARPDQLVTNGAVNAIAHDATGTTYLGGNFTSVAMRTGTGLRLSLTTGNPTGAFPLIDGTVYATVSDGSGGFYIGGNFSSAGGVSRNNLAHILVDGSLGSWNPGTDGDVRALAVSGSTVYVGGAFTKVGGVSRNNLAAVGSDGILGSWNPDANGQINSIVVSGATVYAGGTFTTISGNTRNRLAAIDIDGTLSTTWNPSANNLVSALAVSGSTVYAGGNFTSIDDGKGGGVQTRNHLAAIGSDGTLSTIWNPDANFKVYSLAVSGSTVYVGGIFTTIGGVARNSLAAIDVNGTLNSWNPDASLHIYALVVSDSTVYVGGWISIIGGIPRNYLGAIGTDGTLSSWNPSANNIVYALAVSGSTIYAGGAFTTVGGDTRNRLAAINPDGTLNTTWKPDANNYVHTLAVSGSTVYAGGAFTTMGSPIGSVTRNRLAAIGTDGTLSTTWNPNANNSVNTLAVSGSVVYAGGNFTSIGGVGRNRLAAIGTDGTLSTTWVPVANDEVNAIAISGSTVYAGGWFTTIDDGNGGGAQARNYLAAVGTDGTLGTWAPSLDHSGFWFAVSKAVSSLAISASTVYVGGGFDSVDDGKGGGAQTRNYLAAIGTDGTLAAWNPDAGSDVNALAVSGSTVYAGGEFTTIGGATRNHLAAIDTDGTLGSWDPDVDVAVDVLSVFGSTVYAGGGFTTIGGEISPNFATLAP